MTTDPPRSLADELAARLEREAELVDHGALVVDVERGLDKLGEYQLADPHHYVLRLAEAGVRLGAAELWFWTTRSSLVARFAWTEQPVVLDAATLAKLPLAMLGGLDQRRHRAALVQLAVAVNAARRLGLEQLWIESVGADGRGHRLALEAEPEVTTIADGEPGLWFRLRQSISPLAWLRRRRAVRPELELLRYRAGWAWTPMFVDNRRISHGFSLPDGVDVHDVDGRRIGVAFRGASDVTSPACVVLCAGGIEVERVHPPGVHPGYFAVIEVGLERDLGFARFIRGPAFDRLIQCATAAASTRAIVSARSAGKQLTRRKTRRGRIHQAVARSFSVLVFAMFVAGAAVQSEGLVLGATMLGIMVAPVWVLLAKSFAVSSGEIVPPAPRRISLASHRKPALPPAERPLALPPAAGGPT